MGEIKGAIRNQFRMFCLDSEIEQDSEARVIDVFVDAMDLEQLGFNLRASNSLGRNGYSTCLLYTSPSPRDRTRSRMPSSA